MKRVNRNYGVSGHQIALQLVEIWESKHYRKISILLIREKECQIQDLWNSKNKSNINRSDCG